MCGVHWNSVCLLHRRLISQDWIVTKVQIQSTSRWWRTKLFTSVQHWRHMKSLKNSHHRGVPVADWMLVVAGNVAVAVDNVETTEKDVKKVMKSSTIRIGTYWSSMVLPGEFWITTVSFNRWVNTVIVHKSKTVDECDKLHVCVFSTSCHRHDCNDASSHNSDHQKCGPILPLTDPKTPMHRHQSS